MDESPRRSITEAYRTFYTELRQFLGRRLDSTADAEDLTQETFTHWLKWSKPGVVHQPRAFLYQIARNVLRDHQRRQDVRPSLEGDDAMISTLPDPDTHGGPEMQAARQQRLQQLAQVLEELPPRRREAFILHKFDGLSQAEVAARMGITLSMVEKHVASALLHCKRQIQARERDE